MPAPTPAAGTPLHTVAHRDAARRLSDRLVDVDGLHPTDPAVVRVVREYHRLCGLVGYPADV